MQARRPLAIASLALAALVPTGCGEDEEPGQGTSAAGARTTEVKIADFKYLPETITVSAGDTVTWRNSDDAPHTATADDETFDTGDLGRGEKDEVTFEKAGSFSYYCRFHAFMNGTVEVQ